MKFYKFLMSMLIIGSCKGIGLELARLSCEFIGIHTIIITSRDINLL